MLIKRKAKESVPDRTRGVEINNAAFQFNQSMEYVKNIVSNADKSNQEKILLIDYLMSIIKDDLQAEYRAALFYQSNLTLRLTSVPFPYACYFDKLNDFRFGVLFEAAKIKKGLI